MVVTAAAAREVIHQVVPAVPIVRDVGIEPKAAVLRVTGAMIARPVRGTTDRGQVRITAAVAMAVESGQEARVGTAAPAAVPATLATPGVGIVPTGPATRAAPAVAATPARAVTVRTVLVKTVGRGPLAVATGVGARMSVPRAAPATRPAEHVEATRRIARVVATLAGPTRCAAETRIIPDRCARGHALSVVVRGIWATAHGAKTVTRLNTAAQVTIGSENRFRRALPALRTSRRCPRT